MKTILRIGAMAIALALAAPASAQQPPPGRVGIGLGMPVTGIGQLLSIASAGGFDAPQIYVPINVSPNLRIEPQIGFVRVANDADDTTDSSFTIGAGVFFVKPVAQQTDLYLGGRLAFNWTRDEDRTSATNVNTAKQTNTSVAGVFGGEYLPSSWFSVGAEAQIAYVSQGDIKTTNSAGISVTEPGGSIWSTQGLLFIRVYFL